MAVICRKCECVIKDGESFRTENQIKELHSWNGQVQAFATGPVLHYHLQCPVTDDFDKWLGRIIDHTFPSKESHMTDLRDTLTNIEFQQKCMMSRMLVDTDREFFTLWNPDSERPPRVVYATEEEAWKTADVMAKRCVGQKFFVLRSMGHAVTAQPIVHVKAVTAPPMLLPRRAKPGPKPTVQGRKRKAVKK